MLACKTPNSINQDDVFYSFEAMSYDDGSSSVEAHGWHVRSCQRRKTYASKCGLKELSYRREAVFVNLISKKKDVTWVNDNWANYIAKDYQVKFEIKERLPEGIYTTKQKAIKFAVKKWTADIEWYLNEIGSLKTVKEIECYEEDLVCLRKELKLLKSRLTRIMNLNNLAKTA